MKSPLTGRTQTRIVSQTAYTVARTAVALSSLSVLGQRGPVVKPPPDPITLIPNAWKLLIAAQKFVAGNAKYDAEEIRQHLFDKQEDWQTFTANYIEACGRAEFDRSMRTSIKRDDVLKKIFAAGSETRVSRERHLENLRKADPERPLSHFDQRRWLNLNDDPERRAAPKRPDSDTPPRPFTFEEARKYFELRQTQISKIRSESRKKKGKAVKWMEQ